MLCILTKASKHNPQVAIRIAFPSPVSQLTGNVECFGVKLDCLVVLTKTSERITQVAIRHAFPSPVTQLTGNVETLGVELDCLFVLTKAINAMPLDRWGMHQFPFPEVSPKREQPAIKNTLVLWISSLLIVIVSQLEVGR